MTAPSRDDQESPTGMPEQSMPGRSRRQRAFMLFDLRVRPAAAAPMVGLSKVTAFRYFQQWKRLPPLFEIKYKLAKKCFRKLNQSERRIIAKFLASELCTTEAEILAQLRKPWAIKQIVIGEWKQWPVGKSIARYRTILSKGLQILLSLRLSKEVRHILEMANNQDIYPFENSH